MGHVEDTLFLTLGDHGRGPEGLAGEGLFPDVTPTAARVVLSGRQVEYGQGGD